MTSRGDGRELNSERSVPRTPRKRTSVRRPPYDRGVDPTTQAFLAAVLGAVVAGGAVLAWHISDRQQSTRPRRRGARRPARGGDRALGAAQQRRGRRRHDTVVKASAPAYALGLVRGTAAGLRRARPSWSTQVRRDGQIRETELLMDRAAAPARARHRPGRAAGLAAGAGAGRGPHPRAPGRGGTPRLRRQRQPRAEDPGRRDQAAGRGGRRRQPTTRRRSSGSPAGCSPRATG